MTGAQALRSRRDVVPMLLACVAERLGGEPRASNGVCIVAPSGAGKSHLLREFRDRLSLTPLVANASQATSARPLAVASQLFGRHPGRQNYLERVDALIAAQPLVLVVDDLDFTDAESLGLMRDIVTLDAPIVLVAAGRYVPDVLTRAHVAGFALPLPDRLDIDGFVHERTGYWPGTRLRTLLESIAGNALHLVTVLDALMLNGTTAVGSSVELAGDSGVAASELTATSTVEQLTGSERDIVQMLAVLGRPAEPDEIAGLLATAPMSLVGAAQRLLDAGVLTPHGTTLDFAHDAFREASYAAIPVPLRRTMHRAVAAQVHESVEHAAHVLAAEPDPAELLAVVKAAVDDLGDSPGVTAALLGRATLATDDADVAAELAIGRARALARDGQLRLAAETAAQALTRARDPAIVGELRRVEIFTLSVGGRPREAMALVDATLSAPLPDAPRRVLTDHRRMLLLLDGSEPVPLAPFTDEPRELTLNGLIAELLRRYLLGDTGVAVEYAWAATQRTLTAPIDPHEGMSAELWTPFVTLAHAGADAARHTLHDMIEIREQRDAQWQTATHHAIGGAIDFFGGRLDDAAAQLTTALTEAARMELGAMTSAAAGVALVDVLRGDLSGARLRLDEWSAASEFGLPQIERGRVALLEAERKYAEAAGLAAAAWTTADQRHLYGWLAVAAPDFARVALRANDSRLLATIADTLARMPAPAGRPGKGAVHLASLIAGPEYETVATVGPRLADEAIEIGDRLFAMLALEEGAVAAAVGNDKDEARTLGRRAIELAEDAGARTIAARIAGRLRAAGTRLGAATTRSRPEFGWESLTPTEQRIVDSVAAGTAGPDIARQMHLSTRTVQTHVSHALAKLGLANRVELAAAAIRRNLASTPE